MPEDHPKPAFYSSPGQPPKVLERIASHITSLVSKELGERHAAIFLRYEEGTGIRELARTHFVPPEQVRQILNAVYAWMEQRFSRRRLRILLELPDPPISREALDELYAKINAWSELLLTDDESAGTAMPESKEPAIFKTDLATLPLTQRALNVLYTMGIETVEELCHLTDNQILMARNSGPKTLRNIKEVLAAAGLSLRA